MISGPSTHETCLWLMSFWEWSSILCLQRICSQCYESDLEVNTNILSFADLRNAVLHRQLNMSPVLLVPILHIVQQHYEYSAVVILAQDKMTAFPIPEICCS